MSKHLFRLGFKAGLVICLCTVLHAQQSPADLAKVIQNSIAGKPLMLRNFSANAVTAYQYHDGHLQSGPPILHAFAAFVADKVVAQQGTIAITGSGTALVRDARTQDLKLTPARWKARIDVDLSGMPDGVSAGTVIGDIFSPGLQASLAEVPDYLKGSVPYVVNPEHKGKPTQDAASSTSVLSASAQGVTPPKLIREVTPVFPEQAKLSMYRTQVILSLVVDTDGKPQNLWLVRPAGMGLDEAAAEAVSQYRFRPAEKDGAPVATHMNVEVNFAVR